MSESKGDRVVRLLHDTATAFPVKTTEEVMIELRGEPEPEVDASVAMAAQVVSFLSATIDANQAAFDAVWGPEDDWDV